MKGEDTNARVRFLRGDDAIKSWKVRAFFGNFFKKVRPGEKGQRSLAILPPIHHLAR